MTCENKGTILLQNKDNYGTVQRNNFSWPHLTAHVMTPLLSYLWLPMHTAIIRLLSDSIRLYGV
jgi:hypothetical protein